jgi:hypothetical protein
MDDLTLGELEEFEEITGLALNQINGPLPVKGITALVYLTERRRDDTYTLEQAKSVHWNEVEIRRRDGEEEDPTAAAEGTAA